MATVAHFTIDGAQSEFDQVLTEFHEDDLVIDDTPESPTLDGQLFEVQTTEREILSQFYETCLEHQVMPTLIRIYEKSDEIEKLTAGGGPKNR
jgi:hypothetical protein